MFFGSTPFPLPPTLKRANARAAALLGPLLALVSGSSRGAQATEAGWRGAPLDLGPGKALCQSPVAREQVYQVFLMLSGVGL